MKKLLSFALVLVLLLALLPAAALGYSVVLSPQSLSVDGVTVACEKYNIDGANYFKLRDLAYILMGTDAEFGVSYSAEENSILIVPGMPYDPVGGELEIGEDRSALAVPSAQSVIVLNSRPDGLSVYNIGGNNFFKLRDLAPLLGFTVDYDAATNTAIILTDAQIAAFDAVWSWVQDNYTFAAGEDLYYLMDNVEWDNGDVCEYWLADVTVDGAPALALRTLYLFPDGSAGEAWLFLERDTRPYDGVYNYYFEYGADAEADFTGTVTLDPAVFDAEVSVVFDAVTPGYDQEDLATVADNMTWAVARLVSDFGELISSSVELYGVADFRDFGFTGSALPKE